MIKLKNYLSATHVGVQVTSSCEGKTGGNEREEGEGDDNGRDPRIILVIPKMRANQGGAWSLNKMVYGLRANKMYVF